MELKRRSKEETVQYLEAQLDRERYLLSNVQGELYGAKEELEEAQRKYNHALSQVKYREGFMEILQNLIEDVKR